MHDRCACTGCMHAQNSGCEWGCFCRQAACSGAEAKRAAASQPMRGAAAGSAAAHPPACLPAWRASAATAGWRCSRPQAAALCCRRGCPLEAVCGGRRAAVLDPRPCLGPGSRTLAGCCAAAAGRAAGAAAQRPAAPALGRQAQAGRCASHSGRGAAHSPHRACRHVRAGMCGHGTSGGLPNPVRNTCCRGRACARCQSRGGPRPPHTAP